MGRRRKVELASIPLEGQRKADDAWYDCEVSVGSSSSGLLQTILIVHFAGFEDDDDENILSVHEAMSRLRARSTMLENGQCLQLQEGDTVLASRNMQSGKIQCYDAHVEKIQRQRHSSRVSCKCNFELRWLDSKMKGEMDTAPASQIRKRIQYNIQDHPVISEWMKSVRPENEHQPETSDIESDVQAQLEEEIEKITMMAESFGKSFCAEEVLPNATTDAANIHQGRKRKALAGSRSKAKETLDSIPEAAPVRATSRKRTQSSTAAVSVLSQEETKPAAFLSFDKRPRLSPLAARAALAAAVQEVALGNPQMTIHGTSPTLFANLLEAKAAKNTSCAKRRLDSDRLVDSDNQSKSDTSFSGAHTATAVQAQGKRARGRPSKAKKGSSDHFSPLDKLEPKDASSIKGICLESQCDTGGEHLNVTGAVAVTADTQGKRTRGRLSKAKKGSSDHFSPLDKLEPKDASSIKGIRLESQCDTGGEPLNVNGAVGVTTDTPGKRARGRPSKAKKDFSDLFSPPDKLEPKDASIKGITLESHCDTGGEHLNVNGSGVTADTVDDNMLRERTNRTSKSDEPKHLSKKVPAQPKLNPRKKGEVSSLRLSSRLKKETSVSSPLTDHIQEMHSAVDIVTNDVILLVQPKAGSSETERGGSSDRNASGVRRTKKATLSQTSIRSSRSKSNLHVVAPTEDHSHVHAIGSTEAEKTVAACAAMDNKLEDMQEVEGNKKGSRKRLQTGTLSSTKKPKISGNTSVSAPCPEGSLDTLQPAEDEQPSGKEASSGSDQSKRTTLPAAMIDVTLELVTGIQENGNVSKNQSPHRIKLKARKVSFDALPVGFGLGITGWLPSPVQLQSHHSPTPLKIETESSNFVGLHIEAETMNETNHTAQRGKKAGRKKTASSPQEVSAGGVSACSEEDQSNEAARNGKRRYSGALEASYSSKEEDLSGSRLNRSKKVTFASMHVQSSPRLRSKVQALTSSEIEQHFGGAAGWSSPAGAQQPQTYSFVAGEGIINANISEPCESDFSERDFNVCMKPSISVPKKDSYGSNPEEKGDLQAKWPSILPSISEYNHQSKVTEEDHATNHVDKKQSRKSSRSSSSVLQNGEGVEAAHLSKPGDEGGRRSGRSSVKKGSSRSSPRLQTSTRRKTGRAL